ncbi:MAG: AbgT family transporter [Thermaurantiacus sp.]
MDAVERLSRRVPNALNLFLWLCLAIVIASFVASLMGASAIHPATGETVRATNLLQAEHVRRLLVEMPRTFTAFPPLGSVLVVMIGIGLAERSGLIGASLGRLMRMAPPALLPLTVVFTGIMASIAVDAGFLIVPPLGAAVFWAAGRHPLAGLCAAYAGVSGGFSANLLITGLDPLLAGLTEVAAQLLVPEYQVLATANWFLMTALVPLLSVAGALVTSRIIEPRLGAYVPEPGLERLATSDATPIERRALARTGWAALFLLGILLALTLPEGAVLRDPETGSIQPFFQAIVGIITLSLGALGLVYGAAVGSIRNTDDAIGMCEATLADMAVYILLVFVAAQFLALFAWSNLGTLIAIGGGNLLKASGLGTVPLLLALILLCGLINLFITSASAKWALLAPVFVPMFMAVGISPELTQAAYRVGDSFSNIIAPTMVYIPLLLAFAGRYVPGFPLGRLLTLMLPYSLAFLLCGAGLLALFLMLELPVGPGAPSTVAFPG